MICYTAADVVAGVANGVMATAMAGKADNACVTDGVVYGCDLGDAIECWPCERSQSATVKFIDRNDAAKDCCSAGQRCVCYIADLSVECGADDVEVVG